MDNIYGFSKEEFEESLIPGTSEYWHALKEDSRIHKLKNGEDVTKILNDLEIEYSVHNNGSHYRIPYQDVMIDFWPSSSKFYDKSMNKKGKGIWKLLAYIGILEPETKEIK